MWDIWKVKKVEKVSDILEDFKAKVSWDPGVNNKVKYLIKQREDFDNNYILKKPSHYIYNIVNEIWENNYVLWLINDLLDFVSSAKYKNLVMSDMLIWNLWTETFLNDFLQIKEFLYKYEDEVNSLEDNSIYFKHFLLIINSIETNSFITMSILEKIFWDELSYVESDRITIDNHYYDEMKVELLEFIENINTKLESEKTT